MATRMSPIPGLSGYVLVPLRESADFTLYRGRKHDDPRQSWRSHSLEQPSPQSIRRLVHEYSFAAELDPAWAAKPLAITRHEGRTILVLKDPGGQPLDRILERDQGQPLDLTRFLALPLVWQKHSVKSISRASYIRISSLRMSSSTIPATLGSPDSGLRPNFRASASRPNLPSSSREHSPTWHPSRRDE